MENGHCNSGCQNVIPKRRIDSLALAMAYVPWQQWGDIYKPDEALKQGTIFKELDLPFIGRRCSRS